jgi:cytochrome c oxidase cbb3-type subunit 1
VEGDYPGLFANPVLKFVAVGIGAFVVASLLNAVSSLIQVARIADLTWFTPARVQLYIYGFFALVMFGAAYHIIPQLIGIEFPSAKLIKMHFWFATIGILLIAVPLAIGGIVQGKMLQDPANAFLKTTKVSLMFLRLSTIGDLLILVGHIAFLLNLRGLVRQFYFARAAALIAAATAEIGPAGAKA